jgi:hypothetical protein
MEINVESNIDRIRLQFKEFAYEMEEKATVRALNRAGDQALTAIGREIRRVYNMSAADARRQARVVNRAQRGRLYFTIRISSRRLKLIQFVRGSRAPTVTRRRAGAGVTVEVKRGSRRTIPHAFIAAMPSGHTGVFARIRGRERPDPEFRFGEGSGRVGRKWGQPDIPIGELTTLSVPRMVLERTVNAAVRTVARDSFNRNFEQQVKFLTAKAA